MERDLALLRPEFLSSLQAAVAAVHAHADDAFELRPFCTRRDPWTQARLWRQSRSIEEVRVEITRLRNSNAPFLARVLEEVGPQHGRWATNAVPGLSWHQWCEACDLFVVERGAAIWQANHPGYAMLREEAVARGLGVPLPTSDPYHVQGRLGSVLHYCGLAEVDAAMKERYDE